MDMTHREKKRFSELQNGDFVMKNLYIYIFIYLYHGYIIIYTYIPLSCGLSTFKTLNSKVEVFLVVLFNVAI